MWKWPHRQDLQSRPMGDYPKGLAVLNSETGSSCELPRILAASTWKRQTITCRLQIVSMERRFRTPVVYGDRGTGNKLRHLRARVGRRNSTPNSCDHLVFPVHQLRNTSRRKGRLRGHPKSGADCRGTARRGTGSGELLETNTFQSPRIRFTMEKKRATRTLPALKGAHQRLKTRNRLQQTTIQYAVSAGTSRRPLGRTEARA